MVVGLVGYMALGIIKLKIDGLKKFIAQLIWKNRKMQGTRGLWGRGGVGLAGCGFEGS